jgi:protein-disulfide isomerase
MASRKEQKEQARAARIAQEQATAANAQRRRRLQILGGAVAVAVIVVVVAIVISIGGGATKTGSSLTTGPQAQAAVKAVDAELAGIPQSGTTLGKPSAKVTLIYFGDLQCPICKAFTLGDEGGGLPEFIAKQVRPGNAKVVYRSFCTASCNNTSVSNPQALFNKQQSSAYAAGPQSLFWNYAELFYHLQGTEDTPYVTEGYLTGLAKLVTGLHVPTWQTARKNPVFAAQVASDNTLATKYGVSGTPALFVQGPKGIQSVGSGIIPYSTLASAVQAVS